MTSVGVIVRGVMGGGLGTIPASVTSAALKQRWIDNRDLSGHEARARAAVFEALEVVQEHLRRTGTANPGSGPMSAVVSALIVSGSRVMIVHIGDGRVYRWRANQLEQLTTDHTIRVELEHTGTPIYLRSRELSFPPGSQEQLRADVRVESVMPDDVFVLCSAEVSRLLEPPHVARCLEGARTAEDCCIALHGAAARFRTLDQDVSILVARVAAASDS